MDEDLQIEPQKLQRLFMELGSKERFLVKAALAHQDPSILEDEAALASQGGMRVLRKHATGTLKVDPESKKSIKKAIEDDCTLLNACSWICMDILMEELSLKEDSSPLDLEDHPLRERVDYFNELIDQAEDPMAFFRDSLENPDI